jgi:hypothetical protein
MASLLQTELKQRKPFKSLKEEAHLSLQRTAALLEHAFESAKEFVQENTNPYPARVHL